MKSTYKYLITFILSLLVNFTFASAYWMEIVKSNRNKDEVSVRICYGFIDELSDRHRTSEKEFEEIKNFKVFVLDGNGKKQELVMHKMSDSWEGNFSLMAKTNYRIFAYNDQLPVIVRSDDGKNDIRPIDYLCGAYNNEGKSNYELPQQFLDIVLQETDGIFAIMPYRNQKPSPKGTILRLFNPENWEKNLTIGGEEPARFKTTSAGLYVVRQDWNENIPGEFKGKHYERIRHRCNYCLWVEQKPQ